MATGRTRWDVVALVFVAGLFAAWQFGKVSLTLPLLAEVYGRNLAGVAVLVSVVGLTGLVLGALGGGLVARIGLGRAFLGGLVLGGGLSLAQAALPSFAAMAGLRLVESVGHLALVVAGPPLIAGAASDRARPAVMGLWGAFFGTAFALAAWVFPPVLKAGGLPLLFGLHGAGMLALAALLWRRLDRVPGAGAPVAIVATHRAIYSRWRSVAPGLGFVCYTFLFIAGVALFPPVLGLPWLTASLPVVTLATTLMGGALAGRFTPHSIAAFGFAGTVLGMVAMVAMPLAGIHLAFAAMGLIPGASFAAIPYLNASAERRAHATGAIAQLGNLGTVTGTPIFALAAAGGAPALMALTAGVAALGGALAWGAGRRAAGTPPEDMVDVR